MSVYNIPNGAEVSLLGLILGENLTLKLFKNNVLSGLDAAAIAALTVSSFTEADFTGYTSKALTGGTGGGAWTITGGAPTQGTYAAQTFTSSANQTAQTIYGYYFVATSGGALRGFRQLDSTMTITNNGDSITITPKITLAFAGT